MNIVIDDRVERRVRFCLTRFVYDPVGRCIYCGTAAEHGRLTSEHIYPAGLGGRVELPESSCLACAAITGAVEQTLLRGPLWPSRRRASVDSGRRKKGQPKSFPLRFSNSAGEDVYEDTTIEDHHGVIIVPDLPPPSHMPHAPQNGAVQRLWFISIDPTMSVEEALQRVNYQGHTTVHVDDYVDGAILHRFIAKVAHSFAAAEFGIDSFRPYLLPIIDGTLVQWVGDYTGGANPELTGERGELDLIAYPYDGKTLLLCKMKLLGPDAPIYLAVVGELLG